MWDGCELPAGRQTLLSPFVLNNKGDVYRKAKLVAGGHSQQPGIAYVDTFVPGCSHWTMRIILSVEARVRLELRQFDIRTASLNGYMEEEVYLRTPAGFEYLSGGPGRVLHLHRPCTAPSVTGGE
jgi:hypothetical protein